MSKFSKSNKKMRSASGAFHPSFGRAYEEENLSESGDGSSEEVDGSEDDDESESESGGQNLMDLPKVFYEFAQGTLDRNESPQKAVAALEKARSILLENNDDLKILLEKALKRKADDSKVPPGSALVQRDINDTRYLLCLLAVLKAKIQVMLNEHATALVTLREALVWFPRSIEANYLSGEILRGQASTQDHLSRAEQYYIKAADTVAILQKSVKEKSTSQHSVHSQLQQRLAANLSKHSSAATTTSNSNSNSSSSSSFPVNTVNNDGDDEDEGGEEEENDDEAINQEILATELCCGDKATQALILLYCQSEGRASDAYKYLSAKGFKLKLSNEVLNYSTAVESNTSTNKESDTVDDASRQYLSAVDGAVSPAVLSHLSHVFRADGPFWSEHHYDTITNASRTVGYFSYLYPMHQRSAVSSIEQVIDLIYPTVCAQFPQAREADIVEWWVHSRPHINGHQLHFDSDETRTEAGLRAAHPIVSCVLFVSADVGGPTLVTNQLISGERATKGWLAAPKANRLVTFDASYLHGVIPGKGLNPSCVGNADGAKSRRLTFMVGFWKSISAKDRGFDMPGPGQPFPDPELTKYTWPAEMALRNDLQATSTATAAAASDGTAVTLLNRVTPVEVGTIWESIEAGVDESVVKKYLEAKKTDSASGSSSGSSGSASGISYNTCFQGF